MKKLLMVVGVGCLALTGAADVLLWQMTSDEVTAYPAKDGHFADYAVFYYADANGGERVVLDDAVLFAPGYETGVAAMKEQEITIYPEGIGAAGKSFWVELYDTHGGDPSDLNKVAWSMPISYETLADYLATSLTNLAPVFHPHVTPEPTGGLLLLLGASLLALRRRRV